MTYNPLVPTGTIELDQDYKNLQQNFSQLDSQFGVDHVPFSNTSGIPPAGINGYHESIHFVPQSPAPTATAGYGQLYSIDTNDGIATDTVLKWLTGGNSLIQLTRNFAPTLLANGATCLPGGLIMNWGINNTAFSSGSTTGTETFTQQYPNAVFFVLTTPIIATISSGTPSSQASINIAIDSINGVPPIKNFNWQFFTGSNKYTGFFWIAIGN